ncbi:DNA translocase FtsK [Anaerolentibacter hominis]|uniref:FtsK/SpoIIIE family DNA translocase n=1 Tax=Anaerolentibacter hominis TaxID=3079009 RepID=UPI0031B84748
MAQAGKKKTTGRAGAGGKKKNTASAGYRDEIILIVTLVITILLVLSNFGLSGVVGEWLNHFMFGIMGVLAYVFPYALFLAAAFRISNRKNKEVTRKLCYIGGIMFALTGLFQLIASHYDPLAKVLDYYKISAQNKSGGGIIGGLLVMLFGYLVGEVGAYLVLIAVILILLMFLTGKLFLSAIRRKSEQQFREYQEKRKQRRMYEEEQEAEEEPEPEGNKKRRLFTFDADALETGKAEPQPAEKEGKPSVKKVDMSEIIPEGRKNPPEFTIQNSFAPDKAEAGFGPAGESREQGGSDKASFGAAMAEITPAVTEEAGFDPQMMEDKPEPVRIHKMPEEPKPVLRERVEIPESKKEKKEEPLNLDAAMDAKGEPYVFPPTSLLSRPSGKTKGVSDKELKETAMKLQTTLDSFGVRVAVTNVSCGPAVTRYELQPEQGVKVSKITSLSDDIKLNLKATDIRIEAPIPGKAAVGIEVPNAENSPVLLRTLLESSEFKNHPSEITFAVGRDIGGQIVVTDIAKMPHMLIAGATGSGKSVCINTIVMSILYKANPDDVKLIMVDPKVVELSVYNGIPHLLIPVVTDPKKASAALNWAVNEMTERYNKFAELGVRDLKGYNRKIAELPEDNEEGYRRMPQIVIIVDELSDLMMVAPGEVEDAICRLAQMARAAGLHLIIATQRPSVNVITGLIKANIPSRIAFAVSSAIDSRTILDGSGAEKLLGKGDMLFFPSGYPKPVRIQGAFVSDKEVSAVVDFLSKQKCKPQYSAEMNEKITSTSTAAQENSKEAEDGRDEYFADAGRFIIEKDKASIGMLQRVYRIGFNRAARIMDQLCEAGVVGPEEGTKPRKVLMDQGQFECYLRGEPAEQTEGE